MRRQLHDPPTLEFFRYLVGCALAPTQSVTYQDPFTGKTTVLGGADSLCTTWQNSAPSTVCQTLVSECLMAKQNPYPIHTLFSLRLAGNSSQFLRAGGVRPSATQYKSNASILSLQTCSTPSLGVPRNCGWTRDFIGRCTPRDLIQVGACTGVLGSTFSGDAMLRVCRGIHACDTTSPTFLAQNDDYGGFCVHQPVVTFTCPEEGYFSVEYASYDSRFSVSVTARAIGLNGRAAVYPAPQGDSDLQNAVFTYREGGYFGNIFGSTNMDPVHNTVPIFVDSFGTTQNAKAQSKIAYPNAYHCASDIFFDETLYGRVRACGPGTSTECAMNNLGRCSQVCFATDIAAGHAYTSCFLGGQRLDYGLTSFVNEACALFPTGDVVCRSQGKL